MEKFTTLYQCVIARRNDEAIHRLFEYPYLPGTNIKVQRMPSSTN